MAEMDAMAARLIVRLQQLPDQPNGEIGTADELATRANGLVWLIRWCQEHPKATRQEYLAEVERARRDGPRWPAEEPRVIREEAA